jgi:hypothetical protein
VKRGQNVALFLGEEALSGGGSVHGRWRRRHPVGLPEEEDDR